MTRYAGPRRLRLALPLAMTGPVIALVFAGCGSSSSGTTAGARASQASTPATTAAAAPPRLSIVMPRVGAHTGTTLKVRVALAGAPAGGARRFRYVLDHRRSQLGSARVTLHNLAPGPHRLVVLLASHGAVRDAASFVVRAPAPVAAPPVTTAAPTTPAPATASSPSQSTVPARTTPAPARTAPAPTSAPKRTTTAPAPGAGGIPQNGGGDGDADNSGGPSDGDGNI